MFSNLQTGQGQNISIAEQALGVGGEGQVFAVLFPKELQNYVVKIYHPKERTEDKHLKIKYLKENPPALQDDYSVIWVAELIYENGEFIGFLMKKAISSIDLTYLCSLKISDKLPEEWNAKFGRHSLEGFINRAKLCYNIAFAINQVHQNQHYVLADIKPENIKIKLNGQVSLIDTDSVEVIDNQSVIFPAEKLTTEYSPAERNQINLSQTYIPETWDRFSMAVVFYKVLFGLHPFAATGKGEFKKLASHEQKIEAGLFAHGSRSEHLSIIPEPHQNFYALPFEVKDLFIRTFDEGYNQPEKRPSALEWCNVLQNLQPIHLAYNSPVTDSRKSAKAPFRTRKRIQISDFNYKIPHKDYSTSFVGITVSTAFLILLFAITQIKITPKTHKYVQKVEVNTKWQQKIKELKSRYRFVNEIDEKTVAVQTFDKKYGIISEKGQLTHLTYDSLGMFNEGYAVFKKDGKCGLISSEGKEEIPAKYEEIGDYGSGLVPVKLGDKYGFINLSEKTIINFEFDEASGFDNGIAWVKIKNKEFYIDHLGKVWNY